MPWETVRNAGAIVPVPFSRTVPPLTISELFVIVELPAKTAVPPLKLFVPLTFSAPLFVNNPLVTVKLPAPLMNELAASVAVPLTLNVAPRATAKPPVLLVNVRTSVPLLTCTEPVLAHGMANSGRSRASSLAQRARIGEQRVAVAPDERIAISREVKRGGGRIAEQRVHNKKIVPALQALVPLLTSVA